ncbi:MAG: hypothetical protein OXH10_05415, partial [bacterium]|nr:hypothetical protein [bacterium]
RDRSFNNFITQRQITDLVLRRVAEHVYDRPLINNVERADYVECLVELIMQSADPRWCLTETWDSWDVEDLKTGARVEVKQSSVLQSWSGTSSAKTKASPRFDISAPKWVWAKNAQGKYQFVCSQGRRPSDVYVFAWHGESDKAFADHRMASQWEFFVVPESKLPDQKGIGLKPLRKLARRCEYESLAETVLEAIPIDHSLLPVDYSLLKVNSLVAADPCPHCPPDES